MTRFRALAFLVGSAASVALAVACGSFSDSGAGDADAGSGADASAGGEAATVVEAGPDAPAPTTGPIEVASGLDDLAGVALASGNIYVIEHSKGRVLSIPIAGGAPTEIDTSAGAPLAVAVANNTLFWTDFGNAKIKRRALDGGSILEAVPTPGKNPFMIAPASDRIVVVALGAGDVGEVQQYAFDITAGPSVGGLANPFDVAVAGGKIYWTESAGARVGTGTLGKGDNATFAMGEIDCQSIAADTSGVYWALRSGSVLRANRGTGAETLSVKEDRLHSLVTDGAALYWLTSDGRVRRLATNGGATPTTVASGYALDFSQQRTRALAVNDTWIVWLTTDGHVYKAKK